MRIFADDGGSGRPERTTAGARCGGFDDEGRLRRSAGALPVVTLSVVALSVVVLSIPTLGCSAHAGLDRARRTELQRASLRQVHTAQGELPPPPTADEIATLAQRLREAPRFERRELRRYYPAPDLRIYALRDSDGDGIHDYRVSDYYGRFLEGDLDVDQDGIGNSLDAAPYDPGRGGIDDDGDGAPDRDFADADGDDIPDHVDWSASRSEPMARLQAETFRDRGVLLLDRSASFSERLANAVHDVMTWLFRQVPDGSDPLPALRTIAAEESCLLTAEVDDGTEAMTVPQTRSLSIYRIGIDAPPLVQLGLVVHEMAHVWQSSLDFGVGDLATENRRVYTPAPRFLDSVSPFGWDAEGVDYHPGLDDYRLFTPHYYGIEPLYRYRGLDPQSWRDRLETLYREVGERYLEDPRVVALGIVSDYSLSSPWEWHAENLMAYLYSELAEHAGRRLTGVELAGALATLDRSLAGSWPDFRYRNFDVGELRSWYRQQFPLRIEELDLFLERYLVPSIGDGD